MISSICFSVNAKKATCGVKSFKERWFSKKVFKPFHKAFAKISDKRDAQLFRYFDYKKSIEKFQIYQKKRAFHLNKSHCLKPYIARSIYKDEKLHCVEEHKYISKHVSSR